MARITPNTNLYRLPQKPLAKGQADVKFQALPSAPAQKSVAIAAPSMLDALKAKTLTNIRFGKLYEMDDGSFISMSGPNAKENYLKSLMADTSSPRNVAVIEETDNGQVMIDLETKLFNQLGAIAIEGTVNPMMASRVTRQIQYLASKRVNDDDESPIFLMVNSGGGSVYDGNAILDAMDMAKNTELPSGKKIPIVAWITGMAGSMASVIAVNANKCYMTPRSKFMLHEAAYGVQGKTSEHREQMEDVDELERGLMEVYTKKTGYSVEEFKEWLFKKDRWLNPDKSVWLGIADGILTSYSELVKTTKPDVEGEEPTSPKRERAAKLWDIDPKR